MKLLKEKIDGGRYHIHADSPLGAGYTLCGYAYEGTCDGKDFAVIEVLRGKINYGTCRKIILHCKEIPMRKVRNDRD